MTALDQNNYKYSTQVQQQVIDEGILDGQNMIITSENGSGKTLSYLLPVINDLNKYKDEQEISHGILREDEFDQIEKTNSGFFRFNKQTEEHMFQNANELFY